MRRLKRCYKKLAAYYYNRAVQWGKKVAICYKHDAMMFGSGIVEVERGALAEAKTICLADRYCDCEKFLVLYRYAGVQDEQTDHLQFY